MALDVPSTPYALPVRVQRQVEGGACFESVHGPAGVRRNDGDVFKRTGTPSAGSVLPPSTSGLSHI